MIQPPFLKIGDTIGIMAPSGYVEAQDMESAAKILQSHGFDVFIHPQTYERLHQSAGTHKQKLDALHDLARNPEIKAVLFAAGGNRALHLLDHLDYSLIRANPKIYMGFSDNTVLLNAIHARTGLVTYHGPTARKFDVGHNQMEFNIRLLKGEEDVIPLTGLQMLHTGHAEGCLIGGTLNAFRRLIGTSEMPDATGAILFLEDVGEETSRLDAELCYLRRIGLFDKLGGLIFGKFLNLQDTGRPFGFTLQDCIAEHTAGLKIPVATNAPFGHGDDLYAFPIGAKVRFDQNALHILP